MSVVSSPAALGADQGTESLDQIYRNQFVDKKFLPLIRPLLFEFESGYVSQSTYDIV